MSIKVFALEYSAWNDNDTKNTLVLGEFADESEALTEIWRDLVQTKRHRAYLVFRLHPLIKFWRKPVSIIWGGLHKGVPRIYQEPMDSSAVKKASKLSWLHA